MILTKDKEDNHGIKSVTSSKDPSWKQMEPSFMGLKLEYLKISIETF